MLLMAPRRNNNSASSILVQQQQQHQHQQQLHQQHQHQQVQQQQQQQQRGLLFTASLYNIASNLYEAVNSSNSHTFSNNLINGSSSSTNNNNSNRGMSPMQTSNSAGSANGNTIATVVSAHNGNGNAHCSGSVNSNGSGQLNVELFTRCCYPNGDCLKLDTLIALDDLGDCVRVLCNNENCSVGQYMHRECFESWEQSVLVTLKSVGRARSWSDRQRSQNLWTKKGYDLVYKACGCKCGHGHIRKDLEWSSPAVLKASAFANAAGASGGQRQLVNGNGSTCSNEEEDKKKKKKRNRNNQKPTLAPLNSSGYHQNNQQQQQQATQQQNGHVIGAQNVQNGNSNGGNLCSPPTNKNGNASNCSGNGNSNGSNTNNNATNNITTSPNPNVGVIGSGLHHNNAQQQAQIPQQPQQQSPNPIATLGNTIVSNGNVLDLDLRTRAGSLSSSGDGSGSTSPSASHSSVDICISPMQQQQQQQQHQLLQLQLQQYQQNLIQNGLSKSILSGINNAMLAVKHQATANVSVMAAAATGAVSASTSTPIKLFGPMDPVYMQQLKNKEVELYSERVRLTSGCNGIFSRRVDFSSFNLLPKTRLNSYQVKIEDEGNHGNDETRLFILSSLAQSQMSRVACILCEEAMLVFDRYPLVDGSFFLSPKQHSKGCIEVKYEGRAMYLTCVCMACLDGTSTNRIISCRFCGEIWDGSNLVLGTMYAYDIFAAKPCCAERVKCNNCFKLLLPPQQRLSFYSDYSHCVTCPFCATQDTHFVKPLSLCYTRSNAMRHQPVA